MTRNTQASNLYSLRAALQTEAGILTGRLFFSESGQRNCQQVVTESCVLRRVLPCSPTRALDSIRELREEGVSRRGSEIRRGWPRYGPLRTAKRRVCGA